jgi:hypothetical protein
MTCQFDSSAAEPGRNGKREIREYYIRLEPKFRCAGLRFKIRRANKIDLKALGAEF